MYHYLPETIKPILGKRLASIKREGEACVIVEFDDGYKMKVIVRGDCCSHSIFYDIDVGNAIGGVLLDVAEGDYPEDSPSVTTAHSHRVAEAKLNANFPDFFIEELKVWNLVFMTDKGNALVRHANSSNGYYDGLTEYIPLDQPQKAPEPDIGPPPPAPTPPVPTLKPSSQGVMLISLEITEDQRRAIEQLMLESNITTLQELFRKSFSLLQIVNKQVRNGGTIILKHKDGSQETVIFM